MTPDHSIGLLLYMSGTITILLFDVFYIKKIIEDIRGIDGWVSPEVVKILFILIFPHIIMADAWLGLGPSVEGWLFITIIAIFTIADRWGLMWLSSFKSRTSIAKETKIETNETITTKVADSNNIT